MSEPLRVVAEVSSVRKTLLQLYTGLAMLDRAGSIRLSQRIVRHGSKRPPGTCLLRVNGATLAVDVRDEDDLDDELVGEADLYAKRTFRPGGYDADDVAVMPYGLNYPVYGPSIDLRILHRLRLPEGRTFGEPARALAVDRLFGRPMTPRVSNIRPRPIELRADQPHVTFFTRLWPKQEAVNEQRVACIRALRLEFGPRFVGGLPPGDNADRHFGDCLADPKHTKKANYLRLAGSVPVGVTTIGLSSSTGWKLGEYVAFGRAIVTEPIYGAVPGPFALGTNYVTFTTADECVEACRQLVDDPERVAEMARANAAYYEDHLRPDRLIANLLRLVVRDANAADAHAPPGDAT
jgi:hypothetical protein